MENKKDFQVTIIEGKHTTEIRQTAYEYLVRLYNKDMEKK